MSPLAVHHCGEPRFVQGTAAQGIGVFGVKLCVVQQARGPLGRRLAADVKAAGGKFEVFRLARRTGLIDQVSEMLQIVGRENTNYLMIRDHAD